MLLLEQLGNKWYWKKSREIWIGWDTFLRKEYKNCSIVFIICTCTPDSVLQNKTCVQTLEGHAQNVSCVSFHPELPIIITGSEDGNFPLSHIYRGRGMNLRENSFCGVATHFVPLR